MEQLVYSLQITIVKNIFSLRKKLMQKFREKYTNTAAAALL